jgi:hypothetical protein
VTNPHDAGDGRIRIRRRKRTTSTHDRMTDASPRYHPDAGDPTTQAAADRADLEAALTQARANADYYEAETALHQHSRTRTALHDAADLTLTTTAFCALVWAIFHFTNNDQAILIGLALLAIGALGHLQRRL